jgi:hypothetical protein
MLYQLSYVRVGRILPRTEAAPHAR